MTVSLLELLQIYPIYDSLCSFLAFSDFLRLRCTNSHIRAICQQLSKVMLTSPGGEDKVIESWLRLWAYERKDPSTRKALRVYPPDQTFIARVKKPFVTTEHFNGSIIRHGLMSIGGSFKVTITQLVLDKAPIDEMAVIYMLNTIQNLELLSLRDSPLISVRDIATFIRLNKPARLSRLRIWNMGEIPKVTQGDLPASDMELEPMCSITELSQSCKLDTGICQDCSPYRNRFMPCELRTMTCDSCSKTDHVAKCPDCLIPHVCEACQKYYCESCVPWPIQSQRKRDAHEKEMWRMRFSDHRLRLNFITSDRTCSSYKIVKQSGSGVIIECGIASCFWHGWRHYFHKRCFPHFMAENRFCDFCDLWLCPSAPSEFPVRCLLCRRNACQDCETGQCGACSMGTCNVHEYASRRCGGLYGRGCSWGVCFECMNKGVGRRFDDMEGVIVWWNKENNLCGTCFEEMQRDAEKAELARKERLRKYLSGSCSPPKAQRNALRLEADPGRAGKDEDDPDGESSSEEEEDDSGEE